MKACRFYLFLALMILSLLGLSCAKEQSPEDVNREQRDRSVDRLTPALGHFNGYIQHGEDALIPITIDTTSLVLTSEPAAQLQVDMTLGLFGGVHVYSDSVTYDWGQHLMVATFSKGNPEGDVPGTRNQNTALEFRATVDEAHHTLTGATLTGPNSGVQSVVFGSDQESLLSDDSEYIYKFGFSSSLTSSPTGVLSLDVQHEGQAAPDNVDLPEIPSLTGGLRFSGFGINANAFQSVIYDPLTGHMDLVISPTTRITVDGLTMAADGSKKVLSGFNGNVTMNGNIVSPFSAVRISTQDNYNLLNTSTAASHFTGCFTIRQTGGSSQAQGDLEYESDEGMNPSYFPFGSFPKMTLNVFILMDDGSYGARYAFDLVSVDYINERALFREATGQREFDAAYGPSLSSLSGAIRSAREGSAGTLSSPAEARLVLNQGTAPGNCD